MKTYKNEILEQQPQKSKKISGVQTKEDWLNYRSSRTLQSENKEIYKGLNQAEVCNVEIQFKKWKHLKFWSRDIEIKSPADVAFLFRNLEKENIEHLFAVHHKKDNSVQIQHLGTGNNNSTIGDLPAILAGIEEFETQSITIVHNHPSGTLVSSKADREILKYLNKIIPKDVKINPGIILNLTSGKYLEFDSNNDIGIDYAQGEPIVKYQAKTFSKKIFSEELFKTTKLTSSKAAAEFISKLRFGTSLKNYALLVNSSLKVVAAVTPNINDENWKNNLMKIGAKVGANRFILATNQTDEKKLKELTKELKTFPTILKAIDLISMQPSEYIKKQDYYSAMDNGNDFITNEDLIKYKQNDANKKRNKLIKRNVDVYDKKGKKYVEIHVGDLFEKGILINQNTEMQKNNDEIKIVGGKLKDLAKEAIENPDSLLLYDTLTQDVIKKYALQQEIRKEWKHLYDKVSHYLDGNGWVQKSLLTPRLLSDLELEFNSETNKLRPKNLGKIEQIFNNKNQIAMEKNPKTQETILNKNQNQEKERNSASYLTRQMMYLGFNLNSEKAKELKEKINSELKSFQLELSSDLTSFKNEMNFTLNFNKNDKGLVFFNSYSAKLTTNDGQERTHKFSVSKENNITAKEAINLLEGRAVKTNLVNKNTEELEPAFIKLKLNEEKTDYGNYKFEVYNEKYGVDTRKIVENSPLKFDKDEYKDNTINSLEKGNIVKVKFEHNSKEIKGFAVLNPQYKMINLYDGFMQRLNTNKSKESIDQTESQKNNKIKQHSNSRGL